MIEKIISYIHPIIAEYGAVGVFVGALLEGIIAPIPSPLVPLMAGFFLLPAGGNLLEITWLALAVIAFPVALGTTIMSMVVYGIGYFGGKPIIERSKKWIGFDWKDIEKAESKLTRGKGDEITLFVLRLMPVVPGAAVSGFCGIVRYSIKTFAVVTLLGSFARAFLLGVAGWYAQGAYVVWADAISDAEKYIFIALAVFAAFFIVRSYFLKKNRK